MCIDLLVLSWSDNAYGAVFHTPGERGYGGTRERVSGNGGKNRVIFGERLGNGKHNTSKNY